MSKTVIIGIILLLIVFWRFVIFLRRREEPNNTSLEEVKEQSTSTSTQNQVVDKQASFAIFTNDTFREFSASMYHNLLPDVYIEASSPNIVKIIGWNYLE